MILLCHLNQTHLPHPHTSHSQLSFLRQHVQELEGSERRMISEAQHLRDTLKNSVIDRDKIKCNFGGRSQCELAPSLCYTFS